MNSRTKAGLVTVILALVASSGMSKGNAAIEDPLEKVGRTGENRVVLPVNQILSPAGIQVELPELRPQVIALSPDGKLLATSGKTRELILVDPGAGVILQHVPLPLEAAGAVPGAVSS